MRVSKCSKKRRSGSEYPEDVGMNAQSIWRLETTYRGVSCWSVYVCSDRRSVDKRRSTGIVKLQGLSQTAAIAHGVVVARQLTAGVVAPGPRSRSSDGNREHSLQRRSTSHACDPLSTVPRPRVI
jgi:hypothetical protein